MAPLDICFRIAAAGAEGPPRVREYTVVHVFE
jgi:hypothetical protein